MYGQDHGMVQFRLDTEVDSMVPKPQPSASVQPRHSERCRHRLVRARSRCLVHTLGPVVTPTFVVRFRASTAHSIVAGPELGSVTAPGTHVVQLYATPPPARRRAAPIGRCPVGRRDSRSRAPIAG